MRREEEKKLETSLLHPVKVPQPESKPINSLDYTTVGLKGKQEVVFWVGWRGGLNNVFVKKCKKKS